MLRIGAAAGPPGARREQRRDPAPAPLARRAEPRVGHRARQRDRPHPGRHREGFRGRGPAQALRAGVGEARRTAAVRRQPRARPRRAPAGPAAHRRRAARRRRAVHERGRPARPRSRCLRPRAATSASSARPGTTPWRCSARPRRRWGSSTTSARSGSCSPRSSPRPYAPRPSSSPAAPHDPATVRLDSSPTLRRAARRGCRRAAGRAATTRRSTWCSTRRRGGPRWRSRGTETLRTVLRFGPEIGVHTIGWWRSPHGCESAAARFRVAGRSRLRRRPRRAGCRARLAGAPGLLPAGPRGPAGHCLRPGPARAAGGGHRPAAEEHREPPRVRGAGMSGTDGAQDPVRLYKDVVGELTAAADALRERDRERAAALPRTSSAGRRHGARRAPRRPGPARGGDAVGAACSTRCGRSSG